MARLPQPGGDSGNWGSILNDYLSQAHKTDGSLKDNVVTSTTLAPGSVTTTAVASGAITESKLSISVNSSLDKANESLSESVAAATYVGYSPRSAEQLSTQKATALRPFHVALSRRRSIPVDILVVGHSLVQGAGGTSVVDISDRMTDTFLRALRAHAPTPNVVGGRGSFAANSGVNSGYPAINSGSFTTNGNYGIGRRSWQFASPTVLTFTMNGTGCDIIWTRNTGLGSFSYTVDGGSATVVSATGALLPGQVTQIRGLVAGVHSIVVSVASGTVVVENFVEYNSDEAAGLRMWNGGRGSQQTADFVSASNWYNSITFNPSLVVIACMLNNYGGAAYTPIDAETTKTQLLSMISSIRAKCAVAPSFVLCIEYPRQDSGASNNVNSWNEYVRIAQEIADQDTSSPSGKSLVVTYDLRQRFGTTPLVAESLVGTDLVHPTSAGHQLWGESLARFVLPV